jgi:S-adenosylmethionine/arginine decarboxylase-like enzyme
MPKHVKILGRSSSPVLADSERVRELVSTLIHVIGMQPLGEAQVHDVALEVSKLGREPFEDEGGISCLACLSTSHVAIHTWPLRGEFHLDVYSCRTFEDRPLRAVLNSRLEPSMQVEDLSFSCEWRDR